MDLNFQDKAIIVEALGRYRQFWEDELHKEVGKDTLAGREMGGEAFIAKAKLDKTNEALRKVKLN